MKKYRNLMLSVTFLLTASTLSLAQKNMVQRGHLTFPGKQLANIGGYVDSLGNEYALVGHSEGMAIVNVQDPDNPFVVKEIPGPNSIWREVKTWQHFAYVTTEGGNQGLQVVDLSHLPDTVIPYHNWKPVITTNVGTYTLNTIHALHIDNGYVYLYGANNGSGIEGIVIGSLADPWNPVLAGVYNGYYVHDGYVRNDTVWACHIYDGFFSAIDVSDKNNPVQLIQQHTPSNFTHNSWLSDNSRYLFTTDEVDNSYLAAYDVSDVNNIVFMDKIQSQFPGSQSVVHNTHIKNDYAVTSWYKDGVVITDVHRPENLVNIAWFDTSPLNGGGYDGCWGVYPFLPSGNLVASDIQQGLYVLTPTYTRACYLEGSVIDSICGAHIAGVKVTIMGAGVIDSTDFSGIYKTGTPDVGTYTVVFEKQGYNTVTINGVVLDTALVTMLNITMLSNQSVSLMGLVQDNLSAPLADVQVNFSNANYSYSYTTDSNGEFSQCGLIEDQYSIFAGKWGYLTYCTDDSISNSSMLMHLNPGIYDDFTFDFGWSISSNAASGKWMRVVPAATLSGSIMANPGFDASGDCGQKAYVTGNNNASVGSDDVDDGSTILNSPEFDLSTYNTAHIKYARWFYNAGGTGTPNDSLIIKLSNGTQIVNLEVVTASTPGSSSWVEKDILITHATIPFTTTMKLIVYTADALPGHIVEAGFDYFRVEPDTNTSLNQIVKNNFWFYPNPLSTKEQLNYTTENFGNNNSIIIQDITGREIQRYRLNAKAGSLQLNKELTAGTYLIQVYENEIKTATHKLVINN